MKTSDRWIASPVATLVSRLCGNDNIETQSLRFVFFC